MSTPVQSNAVLVAIRTPRVTVEELESSLQELTRLVNTLGYTVVGHVTQKRSSDKYAVVLGQGKLAELAEWTGGTGKVAVAFERPLHKAASKFEAASDVTEEPDEDDSDDTGEASSGPREQAQIVIVDCDLSPSQLKNLESAAGVRCSTVPGSSLKFLAGMPAPERPGFKSRSRGSIMLRRVCGKPAAPASGRAGESEPKGQERRVLSSISAESAIA